MARLSLEGLFYGLAVCPPYASPQSAAFDITVVTAAGPHLFPFRTEPLSPPAPMILPARRESRSPPFFYPCPPHAVTACGGLFLRGIASVAYKKKAALCTAIGAGG